MRQGIKTPPASWTAAACREWGRIGALVHGRLQGSGAAAGKVGPKRAWYVRVRFGSDRDYDVGGGLTGRAAASGQDSSEAWGEAAEAGRWLACAVRNAGRLHRARGGLRKGAGGRLVNTVAPGCARQLSV